MDSRGNDEKTIGISGTYNTRDTGPSRVTEGVAHGLANHGYRVEILSHGDRYDHPHENVTVTNLGETPTTITGYFRFQLKLYKTINQSEYDIIHLLEEYAGPADVRTVQWTSDILERYLRGLDGTGYWALAFDAFTNLSTIIGYLRNRQCHLIASSPETERQMRSYWKIEPDEVIPLGIKESSLTPPADTSSPVNVLFPGRVTSKKGQKRVLDMLEPSSDTYEVDIVGSLSDENYVNSLSDWHSRMHGFVSRAELDEFYQKSDVVVVPSYHENFSMVALEAMAKGCAVIITEDCGLAKFDWANPENGIYPVEDGEEAASLIEGFELDELETCKEQAYEMATQLTWENVAAKYDRFYQGQ